MNMAKGESLSGNGYYGYKKYYSSSRTKQKVRVMTDAGRYAEKQRAIR